MASTDKLNDMRNNLDEPLVILVDLSEQLGFVARDELQPSNVVTELVELPERI
jgi:hypothetical protein